jgi:hypothetical protein
MPSRFLKADPSEFLFPSCDSDGRSASMRVRIPASLLEKRLYEPREK